ncbi:icarapin-like [Cylas formicarius]|uniref:icarapin-like n=1 Tax=Cylas formicarius TaxID=197179 RepID=UPI0029583E63|nr:icarapin-like [Cylas formicarius]
MKVITAVILSLGFLAVCSGLPASKKDDVEFVPPERSPFGDKPIVDTGAFDGWGGPFSNPFGGLFENIESVMTRMRQQIEDLLKRFPLKRGNSTEEIPDFALEGLPVFPRFGDIDLGKANKTSVTKVIDGHKVVINETAYENQDDLGGTFFKVRIIDVKPDSSEQTTEKEAETIPDNNKDRESSENSFENEIPKSKEVGNTNSFPEKLIKAA